MDREELITYLKKYSCESISLIIVNPDKNVRNVYPIRCVYTMDDMKAPCLVVEVGRPETLDLKQETPIEGQISMF